VSGEGDHVLYPTLPDTSPWGAGSRLPEEPPLGVAIDAAPEPCGNFHEIEASQSAIPTTPVSNDAERIADTADGLGLSHSATVPATPGPSSGPCPDTALPGVRVVGTSPSPIPHRRRFSNGH
jgi:hypothetical protein